MNEHPIHDMMVTAMENLKDMIDVNTIIGEPIETPDRSTVILPVSKVGFGFAAGGSEFKGGSSSQDDDGQQSGSQHPFGGGTGGGVSINPIGFLVVRSHEVKMVHLDQGTHIVEKLMELAPQAVDKVQQYFQQQNQQGRRNQNQSHNQNQNQNQHSQSPNTPE
ncbi:GerW family sporulation protein [Piscibacillus halophilus]|mgnify:CR=1 FL=1|uniref:Sporulation protein YtfJ n=1 Tax=Piscibacillus halophilus TaxID=571933 RepID=A0A1H9MG14_9BACI|nr:GerW family sporulation protein [Piscibacillus halophilus]SER22666.1 sporulation protein YtfJ [Piscibacillus halophilus]